MGIQEQERRQERKERQDQEQYPKNIERGIPNNPMQTRNTLGYVLRWFKWKVTYAVRRKYNSTFGWQLLYYEHIIRDQESLERIRYYIKNNVSKHANV